MKTFFSLCLFLSFSSAFACSQSLCNGSRVMYNNSNNDTGIVVEVFNSGKARVNWDNYTQDSVVNSHDLSKSTICSNNVCVDNRVVFNNANNDTGVVLEVFQNGKATIDWDFYDSNSSVNVSDLGRSYRCNGKICVGERVVFNNANNDLGTVVEVYSTGNAKIDWDNYSSNSVVSITDLGYEIGNCHD